MSSIEISDTRMVSTSGHTAEHVRIPAADGGGAWVVSWCPTRLFDRNQAVTALTLAEFATSGVTGPTHRKWPFMKGWAAELGMDVDEAVRMILAATS